MIDWQLTRHAKVWHIQRLSTMDRSWSGICFHCGNNNEMVVPERELRFRLSGMCAFRCDECGIWQALPFPKYFMDETHITPLQPTADGSIVL